MASKKPAPKKPAEPAPRPSRKAKPKKLGRPPRGSEAADVRVLVRLTTKEHASLEAAAKRAGKPLATFVREAALSTAEKT